MEQLILGLCYPFCVPMQQMGDFLVFAFFLSSPKGKISSGSSRVYCGDKAEIHKTNRH